MTKPARITVKDLTPKSLEQLLAELQGMNGRPVLMFMPHGNWQCFLMSSSVRGEISSYGRGSTAVEATQMCIAEAKARIAGSGRAA